MIAPRWPFVVMRIYLGLVFLVAGILQWRSSDRLAAPLMAPANHPWPIVSGFLTSTIIPNLHGIVPVLAVVHIIIGCLLIAGLGTRIAAAVALILLIAYAAAVGTLVLGPGPTQAYAALALTVVLTAAGRLWGVDAWLRQRYSLRWGT